MNPYMNTESSYNFLIKTNNLLSINKSFEEVSVGITKMREERLKRLEKEEKQKKKITDLFGKLK